MSATFKTGEIAKHVCDRSATPDAYLLKFDGTDVLILSGPALFPYREYSTGVTGEIFGYDVRLQDGSECICEPHELRKKQRPRDRKAVAHQAMLDCITKAKQPQEVPV